MITNFFENKLKDTNISRSDRKMLKVIYTIFGVLIVYLTIYKLAYGLGFLVAKLELFFN